MGTKDVRISVNGDTFACDVEVVSTDHLRIACCPWFEEAFRYDDLIEVRRRGPDATRYERPDEEVYEFVSVVERSPLKQHDFLLSQQRAETFDFSEFAERVTAIGGYSEMAMGGCLFVALPPNVEFDFGELRTWMPRLRRASASPSVHYSADSCLMRLGRDARIVTGRGVRVTPHG